MANQNRRKSNGKSFVKSNVKSNGKSTVESDERAPLPRDALPIVDSQSRPVGATTYDAKDPETQFPPIVPLRPPSGAPNILLIMLDDVGFGASSAFGGPCHTPTAERLAGAGLCYTRFHTTALCSPTRAALLTGRNHHAVGFGSITETATSAPGYNTLRPSSCAPIAETLRLNGYATAQFGKCHEVPAWHTSPVGPFDYWPTGSGFQHFYGFIAGETNQWYPSLYQNTTPVEPWGTPEEGYHLMPDLADKAIAWIRQQKALAPDQPFLVYFAPGATHAPHHVPKEWADKYRGRFKEGWDRLREETFARQKTLGIIPTESELTPRHAEIPAWDEMPEKLKPVLERQMEVYAGFLEYADHHVGRVIQRVEDLGLLDDTLIYLIIGDNGASAEGSINGTFNEVLGANGAADLETPEMMLARIDELGGPQSYNHYAVGWAHAMCTPYQWTKQVASHWGGTRNGMIAHWPARISAKGELRRQFCHVTDIAPSLLEAAGLPAPAIVHGAEQEPYHGTSLIYTFDDPNAPERHETQYFEIFGNRGIYHRGWTAITKHRTPWDFWGKMVPFDEDIWELYDGTKDWTQARDLAKKMPEKLRELQRLFLIEATKYNVLPLDDRQVERINPELAGRPTLIRGTSQTLYPGMGRLNENCMINILNKSHTVTAEIEVIKNGATGGVIINQGGITGGWALYLKEGRPTYCYNFVGVDIATVSAPTPLADGKHQLKVEVAYDGGGLGKGATATLYVDGRAEGTTRIARTHSINFSLDETADVGRDTGSPVTKDYFAQRNTFPGCIHWVRIDVGSDSHEHLIEPGHRLRIAMSKQ